MKNTNEAAQPQKKDAAHLSYLYDFICQCPNPQITAAIKKLVDSWLEHTDSVPSFSEDLKNCLNMSNDEVIEICWLLAVNPRTPPSVLNDLCLGASDTLLERIAENSNTGYSTLAQLSYKAVAEIRMATAGNPATPLASIMLLVEDDNPDVRFCIAENTHVPTKALEILARDDNPYVKMRAEMTLLRAEIEKNVFNKQS